MSEPPSLPPDRAPALRASDADRERVVEVLRQAGGDGRLDIQELGERVSDAYAARTLADLQSLTGDLVPIHAAPNGSPAAAAPGVVVAPGPGGTRQVISVMGGHERRGRWRVAARCLVLSVMGGCDLDLCDAELSADETRIRVFSLMGGASLRLPSGVDVRVTKFALMGGHNVRLDERPPPPGAPVIRVTLLSLMGGAEVRQGRKPPKRTRLSARGDA